MSVARHHQLIKADPKRSTYLACGLLVRGAVQVSDVQRNIERYVHHHAHGAVSPARLPPVRPRHAAL